jgi:hypothetical protein
LADELGDALPSVSDRLIEAMRKGGTMVLRFRLRASRQDGFAGLDGGATVGLGDAGAARAIDDVRRCAGSGAFPAA